MAVYVGVARNGRAAFWFGGIGALVVLLVSTREPILFRIGVGGGMFLFSFFVTGYFHLVFLSKKRFLHIYNWMLLPRFRIIKWRNIRRVRLASYNRECLDGMTETMMAVQCAPMRLVTLGHEAKMGVLDEGLIHYIVLEVSHGKYAIPLEVFRRPKRILRDVLAHTKPKNK